LLIAIVFRVAGRRQSSSSAASKARRAPPLHTSRTLRRKPFQNAIVSPLGEAGCGPVAVSWAGTSPGPCLCPVCFTCKSALFGEPTSGLEPLTCSLREVWSAACRLSTPPNAGAHSGCGAGRYALPRRARTARRPAGRRRWREVPLFKRSVPEVKSPPRKRVSVKGAEIPDRV
jgi:hypothetical protein